MESLDQFLQRKPATILSDSDPILRRVAEPIIEFDETFDGGRQELFRLSILMLCTMALNNGVGLAAPQIGISKRMIVYKHFSRVQDPIPYTLINPDIYEYSTELRCQQEGCLSVPNKNIQISRPAMIKGRAQNVYGCWFDFSASGINATIIQHEIDHLNGILITDHQ